MSAPSSQETLGLREDWASSPTATNQSPALIIYPAQEEWEPISDWSICFYKRSLFQIISTQYGGHFADKRLMAAEQNSSVNEFMIRGPVHKTAA